jgi:uncharacterized protein YndB with AHSA1/START domain
MTDPVTSEIKLFIHWTYPATIHRVFEAWTDPIQMKKWFAPPDTQTPIAEVDLRVGGRYRIGFSGGMAPGLRIVSGIYREIRPPHRLVFTWRWEDDPPEADTLVTIELEEKNGLTELSLTHQNFLNEESRDHHNAGWNGCLEGLAKYL